MIRLQGLGPQFSEFATYMRALLSQMFGRWENEFERALESARMPLTKCQELGGDPRFVLMLLSNARWRRLVRTSPLREKDQIIKRLDGLMAQGTWQDLVRMQLGSTWDTHLMRARTVVLARVNVDEGLFDGVGTRLTKLGAHKRTRHASEALWLLDRHLKHVTGKERTNRILLVDLLNAFDLPAAMTVGPRWVEKRLEVTARKKGRPSLLAAVETFHQTHRYATLFCGKAETEDACGAACAGFRETLVRFDQERRQQEPALTITSQGTDCD